METIDIWTNTVAAAMASLWSELAGFLPNVAAALVILALGYLLARLTRSVAARLLRASGINELSASSGIAGTLSRGNIHTDLSDLVAGIAFWIVMLLCVVSAAEAVGLIRVAIVIDEFILYLPRILGAVAILLGGLYLAGLARDLVGGAAEGIGIEYSGALGSIVYGVLAVIVLSLAVGQLNIEVEILMDVISIVLLSIGLATALAFGIGSRKIATNIIAGSYVREMYADDDEIAVGEISGTVISIGSVKTLILTAAGEVSVANSLLVDQSVTRRSTISGES